MKKQTKQGRLITLLKESGLDEPSADFSQRLAKQVITSHAYRPSHTAAYQKKEWVGKAIIGVLIALNGFMLIKLNPFQTQPVLCWALGGFMLAFCFVLIWIKKQVLTP